MSPSSMYGVSRPLWWVRRRGRSRLNLGFCPWCYSSPPHSRCPVCFGAGYGRFRDGETRPTVLAVWEDRFAVALGRLAAGLPLR